jgi:hypothetical protein
MRIFLRIDFKGNRTYLNGASFFDALEKAAGEFTGVEGSYLRKLLFRRFAKNLCEIATSPPENNAYLVGQGTFQLSSGGVKDFWILETDEKIFDRKPFDEDALLLGVQIEAGPRYARLMRRAAFTPIEEVVALTKALHYKIMPINSGKWVFGQIDLAEQLHGTYTHLDIKMNKCITGRFSINEIFLDDHSIGFIRFIVGGG